jgi:tripartite-type tricarboxylate transporter receptor subunit TctC
VTDLQRRRLLAALAATAVPLGAPRQARAQNNNNKPLTILLTSEPGSTGDTLARMLAERLQARLDRTVLVESKSGGGGLVAFQYMRQYPADGSYMVMCPSTTVSLVPLFSTKPTFDVARDVQAIVDCAQAPLTLTVNPSAGVNTMAEYFDSVRKDASRGSIGVPNAAGTGALVVYQFGKQLDLPLQSVPYRGGAPLLTALLGNQIPAGGSILPDYLAQHRAGRLRILAHASEKRSVLAPDIPTFAEAGYPGYVVQTSIGFYGKAGLPMGIANDYAAIATEALASPPIVEALSKLGLVPVGGTPAALTRKLMDEQARWGPVIRESGIKMDA